MKHSLTRLFIAASIVFATLPLIPSQLIYGQSEVEVKCGDIVEGEFANNSEEHIYSLPMQPRESFEVAVVPAGDDLQNVIGIYGPTGVRIELSGQSYGWYMLVSKAPKLTSGVLSATGVYKIRVTNTAVGAFNNKTLASDTLGKEAFYFGGVGAYTLTIRCTNGDGKITEPGENTTSTDSPSTITEPVATQGYPTQALSFLEVGQAYEIAFGSQTKIIKLVELRDDGWAKIEVNGGIGWLNLNQVALVIPID